MTEPLILKIYLNLFVYTYLEMNRSSNDILEVKRLEQVWTVLADLFQDLTKRGVQVDIASDLRNSRSLINLVQMNLTHHTEEERTVNELILILNDELSRIRSSLLSTAKRFGREYLTYWTERIDKAERSEIRIIKSSFPRFTTRLLRDLKRGWMRLTLPRPIAEERTQEIAERLGVIVEFEDDIHIIVAGREDAIKKAARELYALSIESTAHG